jgi:hypothetical protein
LVDLAHGSILSKIRPALAATRDRCDAVGGLAAAVIDLGDEALRSIVRRTIWTSILLVSIYFRTHKQHYRR